MAQAIGSAVELAPLLARADAIAIGPGLGTGDWGKALFEAALTSGKPLLLDADALNLLAQSARALRADSILTPHPVEDARPLGLAATEVTSDRAAAPQAPVARKGVVE